MLRCCSGAVGPAGGVSERGCPDELPAAAEAPALSRRQERLWHDQSRRGETEEMQTDRTAAVTISWRFTPDELAKPMPD